MKHRLFYTFGLIVLIIVAFVSNRANAQTTAPGPYYATPSWDQKFACDSTSNCPRFIVLSNWDNQAVLDRETGLVWERNPDPNPTYYGNAKYHCNSLTTGNRIGWRLPTVQELASLVDPSLARGSVPTLPLGHPFSNVDVANPYYWSATSVAPVDLYPNEAYGINFWTAGVVSFDKSDYAHVHTWCVRGGQGVDPQ